MSAGFSRYECGAWYWYDTTGRYGPYTDRTVCEEEGSEDLRPRRAARAIRSAADAGEEHGRDVQVQPSTARALATALDELAALRSALRQIADASVVKFHDRSFTTGKQTQWRAFALALQDYARAATENTRAPRAVEE